MTGTRAQVTNDAVKRLEGAFRQSALTGKRPRQEEGRWQQHGNKRQSGGDRH
jgi:hypothetical protein